MSNDNKTLADAQPGGRVRLGDQAERARFEAWAESEGWYAVAYRPDRDAPYALNAVEFAWQAWQAALSAQPSPGGQDALVALVSKWRTEASAYDDQQAKETGYEVDWTYDAKARALDRAADELEVALAARQPVEASEGGFRAAASRQTASAESNATAEALIAAVRQPSKQPDSVALGEATEFCIENGARQPMHGSGTLVDSGALQMALNVLRRAGKDEVADALESTAARQPVGQEPVADECSCDEGGIRYDAKGCTCTACGKRPAWYMGGRRIRVTERRKPWKHLGTPVPFEAECTWQMGDSIDYRLDGESTSRRLNNFHQHWEKVEVIR
jgi:hypothetical protein